MRDYFGKNFDKLSQKKLWLFDMDGTICKEEYLFPGTIDLLDWIINNGGHYVFITNNSSKSVEDYIKKLKKMGIYAEEDNFFTSTQATIVWLKNNMPNAKVYCQGTKSFLCELAKANINVTESVEPVDVVLIGFDTELSSAKIRNTCEILSTQSVTYIATNPDLACPVNFGFIPDCGAICEMIKLATNRLPKFIGKPEAIMVNMVKEKLGYKKSDICVIGDRIYTDIATGVNAGVSTICVLTGEANEEDVMKEELVKPEYTFECILDIYKAVSSLENCNESDR